MKVTAVPAAPSLARMLAAAWARERGLVGAGLVGLLLGLVGLIVLAPHGRSIPPEGDVVKAMAFDVAVGIFLLTLALLVPLAAFSPRSRRHWCALQVWLAIGSFAIVNVQLYRGIDPRFSHSDRPVDLCASLFFGLLALVGTASFLVFAVRLFRREATAEEGPLLLAARYAAVAGTLAYAAGLWMILAGGARVGQSGDILPLHALGFHGLQAVPVVALLLHRGRASPRSARHWVHLAGAGWVGACLGFGWLAFQGLPPLEPSVGGVVILVMLLIWGLAAARAVAAWLGAADGSLLARGHGPVKQIDQAVDGR
jgi:hypothetical protein